MVPVKCMSFCLEQQNRRLKLSRPCSPKPPFPMFVLSVIEHTLRLPPHLLGLPLDEAIKKEVDIQFLDKVISKLGLCISVYDIKSIDGGFVIAGDGAVTYKVVFRLVMFRPFIGEVIVGKLEASDVNGIRLSLGFFKDIYVPKHLLPQPCTYSPGPNSKGMWTWSLHGEELPIQEKEEIHFRVHSIKYHPIPIDPPKDAKPFAPMEIIGYMDASLDDDAGLGHVSWWW
ncbi:hypothetical protein GIB67_008278 [Kingdonia uniflora]|uniref:DNA-directed RNA polymerase subunit n=1 Tax=Kingdonia uniflora TaxID=39325 RepID=A0A7J7N4N0_9MAGN|nr:hypothetical protein GIB67_008278 [Kingdonia uniflora]